MSTIDRHLANFTLSLFAVMLIFHISEILRTCQSCGFSNLTRKKLLDFEIGVLYGPLSFLLIVFSFMLISWYRN